MSKKLLSGEELVAALAMKGVTVSTIGRWRREKKIPFVKVGYRSLYYEADKVLAALARREVKAVSI